MLRDYFSLVLGNLKHQKLRTFLTMLGVFIGIAAVVSLISLGNGLQQAITGQFSTLDPDKLVIQNAETGFGPPGSTVVVKLNSHDKKVIESTPGVSEVIPRLIRVVKVQFNKITQFEFVTSIPLEQKQADIVYDALNVKVEQGRTIKAGEKGKVILGNDFTDKIRFEKQIKLGDKIKIQGTDLEVVGILKKASTFQINSVVFMAEDDLRNILKIKDEIDLIVVQVSNANNLEATAKEIERKLRNDRNEKIGEEDFSVQTPLQSIQTVSTILTVIQIIVSGIAAISLLIGGIGIANTMFTSVVERRKTIGIMKAVGAKNSDILSMFIIESMLLGLIGGIIGAILGLGLAFAVSSLAGNFLGGTGIEVMVSIPLIVVAISFSIIIGIISGIIPAFHASKLNPVDAIRK